MELCKVLDMAFERYEFSCGEDKVEWYRRVLSTQVECNKLAGCIREPHAVKLYDSSSVPRLSRIR